ncbi:hypothetical protein V1478_009868 [Vespula squamosa]|uniref:Uncharacterized protein n=1 Tax=Vespula squamosa TaxID=30214 RepID=A0ABD2AJM9_VESSQ
MVIAEDTETALSEVPLGWDTWEVSSGIGLRQGSDMSSNSSVHNRLLDANTGRIGRTLARVSVGTCRRVEWSAICKRGLTLLQLAPAFLVSTCNPANANCRPVGPQMQQPPRGGTWVGSTCNISKSFEMQVLPSEWLHI